MARTRHYKKIEKNAVTAFLHGAQSLANAIGRFFVKIFKICDSKLTIMIVPHAQGKVINFRTNVFALAFGIVLIVGIVSSFIYFKKQDSGIREELARSMKENRELLASFDELRDENNNVLQTAKRFRSSLSQTLSLLGINQSTTVAKASVSDSDLNSLFDTQDTVAGSTREASDMRALSSPSRSFFRIPSLTSSVSS